MRIRHIQRRIEESLASLVASRLPPRLEGLRQLPVIDRNPQVSIRYVHNGRKVREDAAASYFDPDRCEVVIRFVPFESSPDVGDTRESRSADPVPETVSLVLDSAADQLVEALREVEGTRQSVGLQWFRDQARDPKARGSVLRQAMGQRLVLTSQVPNPVHPHLPVAAIRVNHKHARFLQQVPNRGARFAPFRIQGGSIADTVLGDRR